MNPCPMCMGTDCAQMCAQGDCYWEHEQRRVEAEEHAAWEAQEQARYEAEMQALWEAEQAAQNSGGSQ